MLCRKKNDEIVKNKIRLKTKNIDMNKSQTCR